MPPAVGRVQRFRRLLPVATSAVASLAALVFLWRGRWLVGFGCAWLALLPVAWRLSPSRRILFAIGTVLLSTVTTLAFVAGLDLYLHHRFARTGGYNIWGYRGDVVGRKAPGERRIEFLGGSVAFGYGVTEDETIPSYLQHDIGNQMATAGRPAVTMLNLGWNSEGAHSFAYTLKDYEYLKTDVAVLYSGYNDLLDLNNQVFRHESAVFRLTGYLPILPIIPLRDWRRISNLSDTAHGKIVFTPGLADRYATEAADTALRISQALERQLGKLAPSDVAAAPGQQGPRDWQYYLRSLHDAVAVALAQGQQVFVVTEPYISNRHVQQQGAVAGMLRTDFADQPRVHYVNAGQAVELHDRALSYDGMHLTAAGNRRVAAWLAPELQKALR